LVILTDKINTSIALTTFLKKCEKCKGCLDIGTEGVRVFETYLQGHYYKQKSIFYMILVNKCP